MVTITFLVELQKRYDAATSHNPVLELKKRKKYPQIQNIRKCYKIMFVFISTHYKQKYQSF